MTNAAYDKSIGTENRSVVAATKLWAIILGIVLLIGIGLLVFLFAGSNTKDTGGSSTDNTATRPAEP